MPRAIQLTLLTGLCLLAFSAAALELELAGKIIAQQGKVEIYSPETRQWQHVLGRETVNAGETIRTGSRSSIAIRFEDESLVRLRQNSVFTIIEVEKSAEWSFTKTLLRKASGLVRSLYELTTGSVWLRNNNKKVDAQISSGTYTYGIRGTEIAITTDASGESSVAVLEGQAFVENKMGNLVVDSGQVAVVNGSSPPNILAYVNPEQAVQWTIQFPQNLQIDILTDNAVILEAYDLMQIGEFDEARGLLDMVHSQGENPDLVNLLTAFISLLTNDYGLAERILTDQSIAEQYQPTRLLLLAYLKQLRFDLDAAETSYLEVLRLDPKNEAAIYHLAALYFGSDRNNQARQTIAKLLGINPTHTGAQSLKGFLLFANRESGEAQAVWSQILDREPGYSDAWFGLSLVQMRAGETEEALASIASAITLNPQSSLYLSYWGRMLYQLGRYDRALLVFRSAQRLDPNDPTPVFYQGLVYQDLNRMGKAIAFFQQAIELNDNRGVFRSRSLLDKDLAVRNVDLSKAFVTLGLREWAAKKATDAVQADFSNYSAHLMLAGAYQQDPNRTYLFLNETLQALMFLPASSNSFNSYNHYSSLVEAPDLDFVTRLELGSFNQVGAQALVAGNNPDANNAYSVSLLSEQTDGWRDSNGENNADLTLLYKWQPSNRHNSFVTLSGTRVEIDDDLFPRYEIDAPVDDSAKFETEQLSFGFGYHLNQNANWDQLLHLTLRETDLEVKDHFSRVVFDNDPDLTIESDTTVDQELTRNSLQWQSQYRGSKSQGVFGFLAAAGNDQATNQHQSQIQNTGVFTPLFDIQTSFDLDYDYTSVYAMGRWKLGNTLQTEVSVYYDQYNAVDARTGGEWEINETHPRIGVAYSPNSNHTLRLASFEYLIPDVSARLDPSEVVGIPIIRNNQNGAEIAETAFQWEYEMDAGLLMLNVFKVEKSLTTSRDNLGVQAESTADGEAEGVELTLNRLIDDNTGISFSLSSVDIDDETAFDYRVLDLMVNTNRKENSVTGRYHRIFRRQFRVELEAIYRDMDFKDARPDEALTIVNAGLIYEFNNKKGELALTVENLLGEQYNWVTDPIVIKGYGPESNWKLRYVQRF